jgi:hypothetical protein
LQSADGQLLRQALEALPLQHREVLVRRELEDLSYAEIAKAVNIPTGTVMSSPSRARNEPALTTPAEAALTVGEPLRSSTFNSLTAPKTKTQQVSIAPGLLRTMPVVHRRPN